MPSIRPESASDDGASADSRNPKLKVLDEKKDGEPEERKQWHLQDMERSPPSGNRLEGSRDSITRPDRWMAELEQPQDQRSAN